MILKHDIHKVFFQRAIFSLVFLSIIFVHSANANSGVLDKPTGPVILTVSGEITNTNAPNSAQFDRGMLEAIGMHEIRTTTPWTKGVTVFEGVRASDLLKVVGASGEEVRTTAINDYSVVMPVADLENYPVILALKKDGAYMTVRNKGPLWIIYPWNDYPSLKEEIYFERSVWQLNKLEFQ